MNPLLDYRDRVVIVDTGMSNLFSVFNSLNSLGCEAFVSNRPDEIVSADRIVLPGVGSFGAGMQSLRRNGIADALLEAAAKEKPLLGICLGMQLLATEGFEHGKHTGLDLIPGQVVKLTGDERTRIPHVGWSDVQLRVDTPLYEGMATEADFYFVHSYQFLANSTQVVTGWCEYGNRFAASVQFGSVMGVQFHPEKSHHSGLNVLKNFLVYPWR